MAAKALRRRDQPAAGIVERDRALPRRCRAQTLMALFEALR